MPQRRTATTNGRTTRQNHRCIVLTSDNRGEPASLLRGLEQRGAQATVVDDAPSVMLHLAQQPTHAVIIDEPGRVKKFRSLLMAIRTYYPAVTCWQYERVGSHGEGNLTPIVGTRPDRQVPASLRAQAGRNEAKHGETKRENERVPSTHVQDTGASSEIDESAGRALVTQEELDLLLGPVPEDE